MYETEYVGVWMNYSMKIDVIDALNMHFSTHFVKKYQAHRNFPLQLLKIELPSNSPFRKIKDNPRLRRYSALLETSAVFVLDNPATICPVRSTVL
jgi:hypothetical protein